MSKQSEFTRCLMSEIGRGRKYRDEEPMMIAKQRCLDKGDTKNIMRFTQELLDTAYDAGKAKDFQDNQWLYNSAHDTRKELHKYLNVEGFRKALLSQIGDVDREKETFAEYEARIKAGIKRDLSPTQERQLLSQHATGDFEYGATNLRETMRVLIEKGYAKENKNRQFEITPKGVEYVDEHSLAIRSGSKPKSKEMTQYEKTKLQEQLERYDAIIKESRKPEKKIAEKGGQMTLFGKLPDAMSIIQHSTAGYGRFEDWMRMELDLDPSFGPMSLRWLKEHLSDRQEALLKKEAKQSIYSKDQTNYSDILNHIRYLKKGIPSYGPELLETTLYKIFEMAKTEKEIAPWEETRKQVPESKGQMTLFGRMVAKQIAMRGTA